jgi:hypothetical protein
LKCGKDVKVLRKVVCDETYFEKPWSDDCDCKERRANTENLDHFNECPVCEWGAGECKICGAVECELSEMPACPGHTDWRNE